MGVGDGTCVGVCVGVVACVGVRVGVGGGGSVGVGGSTFGVGSESPPGILSTASLVDMAATGSAVTITSGVSGWPQAASDTINPSANSRSCSLLRLISIAKLLSRFVQTDGPVYGEVFALSNARPAVWAAVHPSLSIAFSLALNVGASTAPVLVRSHYTHSARRSVQVLRRTLSHAIIDSRSHHQAPKYAGLMASRDPGSGRAQKGRALPTIVTVRASAA